MLPNPQPLCEQFNARAGREGWPVVCDGGTTFDSDALKNLLGIWRAVKGDRRLPTRADFSARALIRHLPDISFIERVQDGGGLRRYRFRMVGRRQIRGGGPDPTGKFLDEVIGPQFIASWNASYDMALDMAAPLRFVSNFRALNLEFLTAESLVVPLGDESGMPHSLLTSTIYSSRAA